MDKVECELRRCTAYGCGKPWPHPAGSTSTLCPECFAAADRVQCLRVLELRQIKLNRLLSSVNLPQEKLAELRAVFREVVQAASEIRNLPMPRT